MKNKEIAIEIVNPILAYNISSNAQAGLEERITDALTAKDERIKELTQGVVTTNLDKIDQIKKLQTKLNFVKNSLKETRDQSELYALEWWERFKHPINERENGYNQDVVKRADEALKQIEEES